MYNVPSNSIQILLDLTLKPSCWMEEIFNSSNRQDVFLWGTDSVDKMAKQLRRLLNG